MAGPIVLLKLSGRDQGDATDALLHLLDVHGARVLDIGRAEIHSEANLGMLLQLGPERDPQQADAPAANSDHAVARSSDDVAALRAEVAALAQRAGVAISLDEISLAQYQDWASAQGRPRYIVTLLARQLLARQLLAIQAVVRQHGLTVRRITRLSGRPDLAADAAHDRAIVEFELRGKPLDQQAVDQQALRRALLATLRPLDVDVSVQMDDADRRNRRLVAFDMDSTLIQGEVIDELAAACGVGDKVAAITAAAMRGELDFTASLTRRVAMLEGADASLLEHVAANLRLSEGAARLIRMLKRHGYRTAILSGGFQQVGERLRARLGIDHVFANTLEIENGRLTGRVSGIVVDGARKAALLRELVQREGLRMAQAIAVGDGANDLPMLSIAGLGVAFRAKPIVAESADHAITHFGLDAILYLIGFSERDVREAEADADASSPLPG